jgi:hypothetical protein
MGAVIMNQSAFSLLWSPIYRLLITAAVISTLSACDVRPGTTSGGGADTATPTVESPRGGDDPETGTPGNGGDAGGGTTSSPHAGTYNGTVSYTATGLGRTIADSDPISIVIGSDGKVTINGEYAGVLSGDSFSITQAGTTTVSGVTCTGTVSVNGTVSGGSINGTFQASSLSCDGIPIEFNGTFNAARIGVAAASVVQPSTLLESITETAARLIGF